MLERAPSRAERIREVARLRRVAGEELGLPADHREGCRQFMQRHLFSGLDVPPENWHVPDGTAPDPEQAAATYEAMIAAAGGLELGAGGRYGDARPGAVPRMSAGTP